MSLLLLDEHIDLVDAGGIESEEAIGEPTITLRQLQGGGTVVWPWWTWARRQPQQPVQLKPIEPELEEQVEVIGAGGIPSAERVGSPTLTLEIQDAGGIESEEAVASPTVKPRRLRTIRRAEEAALFIWRKAA